MTVAALSRLRTGPLSSVSATNSLLPRCPLYTLCTRTAHSTSLLACSSRALCARWNPTTLRATWQDQALCSTLDTLSLVSHGSSVRLRAMCPLYTLWTTRALRPSASCFLLRASSIACFSASTRSLASSASLSLSASCSRCSASSASCRARASSRALASSWSIWFWWSCATRRALAADTLGASGRLTLTPSFSSRARSAMPRARAWIAAAARIWASMGRSKEMSSVRKL
mmetsp:Transcript_13982/g.35705  ORF Transcript_13982/g.35705 Transcript_13982/m.35705 type:complete len:229 (-) Transcript_13982:921-1607(-)